MLKLYSKQDNVAGPYYILKHNITLFEKNRHIIHFQCFLQFISDLKV